MKNILVAIDFSQFTDAVLAEAVRLSSALNTKLWILHVASNESQTLVFEPTQFTGFSPDMITPGDVQLARDISADEIKREHAELLTISSKLRNDGVEAQTLLLKGDPARLILEKAKELEAEMIILGSHGHGRLHKALLGSVSESIIRHAECKILIVPSQGAAES